MLARVRHLVRSLAALLLLGSAVALADCSSSSNPTPSGEGPMTCEASGYLTPGSNGSCGPGTCIQNGVGPGASLNCCGSVCTTCESEGYMSFTDAGTCPPGTCPSGDVTASLVCCGVTVCGEPVDAGVDAPGAVDGGSDSARADASKDGG
jgi:hypothetical protein